MQESKSQSMVESQSVKQFLNMLETEIMAKSSPHNLSSSQLKFIENLPTMMVFSCLQWIIQWLKDGRYDFHKLPFTLMAHLPIEDQNMLNLIPKEWQSGMVENAILI